VNPEREREQVRRVLDFPNFGDTLFYLSAGDCSDRLRVTVYSYTLRETLTTFRSQSKKFLKRYVEYCRATCRYVFGLSQIPPTVYSPSLTCH